MQVNCALIGSGNIGTDLMYKLLRSEALNPVWMVGIDPQSEGLLRARRAGLKATDQGVDALLPHIDRDEVRIAFDATSARCHRENAEKLAGCGVKMVDLTPAAIGPCCIPPVNLQAQALAEEPNINMVTCGGQATIPIVHAVSRVQPVEYGEIVATTASKSAGPGTRKNIDEFTRTTARAIERIGGAERGKAIIILNPAEPPIVMRDTVHCLLREDPDEEAIRASLQRMEAEVQQYVQGYRIKEGPVFDGRRVTSFLEVEGAGDYLPTYAGNLDIMTAAAARAGELMAAQFGQPAVAEAAG